MVYKNSIKAYASRSRRGYSNTMMRGYAQGAGAVALGVAGYKLAKKLKEKINTEFKGVVSNYSLANIGNIDASASKHYLTGIDQGDTGSTRDGSQVRLKGITIHGNITVNQSSAGSNTPQLVRMIVFKQKTCQATAPSLDDVINAGGGGNATLGFYNLDNVPINFQILRDKTFTLSDEKPIVYFNEHFKQNDVMRYDGTTSAYADQSTNGVHVYFVSNVGSNLPDGNMSVRVRYVDN